MNHELRQKLDKRRGGVSIVVVGPAGTGKSTFCGSISELYKPEEIQLIAPKPREINSWIYTESGISEHAVVFQDDKWLPTLGRYEATAFTEMEKYLIDLYEDETKRVIIFDPYTDLVDAAGHELLKKNKAGSPGETDDSRTYYGNLKHVLQRFTKLLVNLSSPALKVPKHVIVAVHAQSAKAGEKEGGVGVSFEGEVMPMIEGGHRHAFASEFDIVCYTRIKHKTEMIKGKPNKTMDYLVQVGADNKRHAKISLCARLDELTLPNSLPELFNAIL